jgi:mono/diheme cytochrome c family protein
MTLGEAADVKADLAIAATVKHAPTTQFLQEAAVSGLAGRELTLLKALLKEEEPQGALRPFVGALARCVFASRNSERVSQLLRLVVSSSYREALVEGILQTSSTTAKKPVKFKAEPEALAKLDESSRKKILPLITWPGKPGARPEPPVVPLTAAQQSRYEMGKTLFSGVCAACHQPHGMGLDGVAPPLVDSEWVLGTEQRLVRIVLHGLTGPISVKGKTYRLDMPPLGVFTDEQVASILTYIRREWEHTAGPVEPETVKAIRAASSGQHESWLPENLLKIK